MNESSFPGLDVLALLRWLLIAAGVSAVAFRRFAWIRVICVLIALFSVVFGYVRIDAAPRMAMDQLAREKKTWTEEFRDGSRDTINYVRTSIPTFVLAAVVLATLALVPAKTSSNES